MKANKMLIMLAAAFLLCACEPQAVRNGRKLYKKYYQSTLEDPSSFKVYKETYTVDGKYKVNWTIDYGAKNSFGGMVRKTDNIITVGNSIFVNGEGKTEEEL